MTPPIAPGGARMEQGFRNVFLCDPPRAPRPAAAAPRLSRVRRALLWLLLVAVLPFALAIGLRLSNALSAATAYPPVEENSR